MGTFIFHLSSLPPDRPRIPRHVILIFMYARWRVLKASPNPPFVWFLFLFRSYKFECHVKSRPIRQWCVVGKGTAWMQQNDLSKCKVSFKTIENYLPVKFAHFPHSITFQEAGGFLNFIWCLKSCFFVNEHALFHLFVTVVKYYTGWFMVACFFSKFVDVPAVNRGKEANMG